MRFLIFVFFISLSVFSQAFAQMQQPKNFQLLQPGYWQQTVQLQSENNQPPVKTEFRCMTKLSMPGFMSAAQSKQCSIKVIEDSAKVWKIKNFCPSGLQTDFRLEMLSPLQGNLSIESNGPKGRSTLIGQLKFLGSCPEEAKKIEPIDPDKLGKLSAEQCRMVGIQYEAMAPDKAAVTCSKYQAKLKQTCLIRAARSYKNLDAVLKTDACKS
jgi:hypothetical protein